MEYSMESKVLASAIERYNLTDERIIRKLACKIIEEMKIEDLRMLFNVEKMNYDEGQIQRERHRMTSFIRDFQTDSVFVFNSHARDHEMKMQEIFNKTEGGMCTYHRVSLKV